MPTRYIVHGTDAKGQAVQKIIEAGTAAEAEQVAGKLGVSVAGSEVDPSSVAAGPRGGGGGGGIGLGGGGGAVGGAFADDDRVSRRLGPEVEQWKGTPSQWVNFWWWAGIITIPYALWKYFETKYTTYTLTSQRLRMERGVLTKSVDEVELYRIKDTQLSQTVWDRVLNIGTIEVLSSDETNPKIFLPKIPNPREVREQLRLSVEKVRLSRGVREVDVAWESTGHS